MSSGECQTKNRNDYDKKDDEKPIVALDEGGMTETRILSF